MRLSSRDKKHRLKVIELFVVKARLFKGLEQRLKFIGIMGLSRMFHLNVNKHSMDKKFNDKIITL